MNRYSTHAGVHFNHSGSASRILDFNMEYTILESKSERCIAGQFDQLGLLVLWVRRRAIRTDLLEPGLPTSPVVGNFGINDFCFKKQNINIKLITIVVLFQHHFCALSPDCVLFDAHRLDDLSESGNRVFLAFHAGYTHACRTKYRFQDCREADDLTSRLNVCFAHNLTKLWHGEAEFLHNLASNALVTGLIASLDGIVFQAQGGSDTSGQGDSVLKVGRYRVKLLLHIQHDIHSSLKDCGVIGEVELCKLCDQTFLGSSLPDRFWAVHDRYIDAQFLKPLIHESLAAIATLYDQHVSATQKLPSQLLSLFRCHTQSLRFYVWQIAEHGAEQR
mmetsp:Transcript_21756/g.37455  ORF Transcript_21756/g.37455 Transcript_21756/m.37455 type:complete len:333 (+) Transcript_21756:669-1667(+)